MPTTLRTPKEPELPLHPDGWYCVALSGEIKSRAPLTRLFMNRQVVLRRADSGAVVAVDASDGGTGRTYPVTERAGLVLVYYDQGGEAPTWTPPEIDMEGWSPTLIREFSLRGHPQETSENSVDVRHLEYVHKYVDVKELHHATTTGPYLYARYGMTRRSKFGPTWDMRTEFDVHVHGLGYSVAEVEVPKIGIRTRQFVLPTPTSEGHILLRIGLNLRRIDRPSRIHPALGLMPASVANALVARATMWTYAHDVGQDFEIWRHKKYVAPPILAAGDGPIGIYRRWARQFYPELRRTEPSAA